MARSWQLLALLAGLAAVGGCSNQDIDYSETFVVVEPEDLPPDIESGAQPISAEPADELVFDHRVEGCDVERNEDTSYRALVVRFSIVNPLEDSRDVILASSLDVPTGGYILDFVQIEVTPGRSYHLMDLTTLPSYNDLDDIYLADTGACSIHFLGIVSDPHPIESPIVDSYVFDDG